MNNKDLADIRARCDAATHGERLMVLNDHFDVGVWTKLKDGCRNKKIAGFEYCHNGRANAELFANAYTDIPALLDEIARLTKDRDAAVADLKQVNQCHQCAFDSQCGSESVYRIDKKNGYMCKHWKWRGTEGHRD